MPATSAATLGHRSSRDTRCAGRPAVGAPPRQWDGYAATRAVPRLYGRDDQLAAIGEDLSGAVAGRSGVVLIEGEPGIGKTRLLEEALRMARRAGVRGIRGASRELEASTPFGPLLSALFGDDQPLLSPTALRDLSGMRDQRFWLLQELHGLLEAAVLDRPLLIALDDLQWADPGTLWAVSMLSKRLAPHPVVWLLTHRTHASGAVHETLTTLTGRGARRIRLAPLDGPSVAAVSSDLLGGDVEPAILAMAERAQGNPFLLVELLRALVEDGDASPDDPAGLPVGFAHSLRGKLDRLSATARAAVQIASVLGRDFDVDHLARMLEASPVVLLDPLREALDAGLLREDGKRLAFRHDLIREAVHLDLPAAVRDALHRQAAEVLLEAGASPVEAVGHVVVGAQPGDRAAIETLRAAAREVARTAPAAAADFSVRAIELTPPDDPALGALRSEAIPLLVHAGRLAEARAVADEALVGPLSSEEEARVRLGLALLLAPHAPDDAIRECRRALALDGLFEGTRAELLAMVSRGLAMTGDAGAGPAAAVALEAARDAGDPSAEASALVDVAAAAYRRHRWQEAEELLGEASRLADADAGAADASAVWIPRLWQSTVWGSLDRFDEALAATAHGLQQAERDGLPGALRLWTMARCRLLLDAGRLADARAEAEALLALQEESVEAALGERTARYVLASVAVHAADGRAARVAVEAVRDDLDDPSPLARGMARVLTAMVAEAQGDDDGAMALLAPCYDALGGEEPALASPEDPTHEPWLVRLALRGGDRDRAEKAARAAERRAAQNPGVASLAASAAHARALLDEDRGSGVDGLLRAVELFAASPRMLGRAAALEDAGSALARAGRRDEAVERLDEALVAYVEAGAEHDGARVRRALRALGVRRRLGAAKTRPRGGWLALTESELQVVRVVADGTTNRQAAERLFLSPHTVSSHLRRAFAKLGINSRAELVRVALEHEGPTG